MVAIPVTLAKIAIHNIMAISPADRNIATCDCGCRNSTILINFRSRSPSLRGG
jgi:hypothetical protein